MPTDWEVCYFDGENNAIPQNPFDTTPVSMYDPDLDNASNILEYLDGTDPTDATDVLFANNLLSHNLRDRGGDARLDGNITFADPSLMEDPEAGAFYLVPGQIGAVDGGVMLPEVQTIEACQRDIEGNLRGAAPDVGAYETLQ